MSLRLDRVAGVDLRLAVAAGAAWLSLALCEGHWPSAYVVVAATGALLAGLALAARAPGARALALAACCTALILVPAAARVAHAMASPLDRLASRHAAATLVITLDGDPVPQAATGPSGVSRMVVPASVESAIVGGHRTAVDGGIVVLGPARGWLGLLPGQRVLADGKLLPPQSAGSAPGFSVTRPPQLSGAPPWWQRAAGQVRDSLRRAAAVLPDEERGLLPGLIDGDTAALDPVLADRFRTAGLTHLVAVSGTNCSILIGAALLLMRRLRVRPAGAAAVAFVVLVAFVVVARGSPSVLRAALMAAVALVALASGRHRQVLPALALAVIGVLLWQPALAVNAGFAMSVLATAALVLLAPPWACWLAAHGVPLVVAEALAVASAAHLVTAPIIAALSGRVSLVAIPANVLAEPMVAIVTVIGFLAAATAPFSLALGQALAWLAGWPCRWLVFVADRAGALDGAALPWASGLTGALTLLGILLVLGLLAARAGPLRSIAAVVVLLALLLVPVRSITPGWPPAGWVLVACDVGQGDGLVLPSGYGSAVVIDTGPDPVLMDRCLHDLGITDISLLVLTHFHLDHVGGVVGALHGRRLGRVLVSALPEPAGGVDLVEHALAGRSVNPEVPSPGATYQVGTTTLQVLGPASPFHDTRSDPNNSSLMTRATVRGVRILLTADAEIEAQQAMMAAQIDVTADVLKVPHHGSAYFDPAFLAAVHAQVAVISVGLHNDYGHPAPSLLAELSKLHLPVRRTDHDGDVAVVATSHGLATVTRQPVPA